MKKVTLLLVLCCLSLAAFSQAMLTATGASGSYTTGSASASTRTDDDIISTSTTQNGYAVFDLSSIPAGSDITSCRFSFYVSAFTPGVAGVCNTYGFAGDLSTVTTPATLFSDITSGTLLFSATAPAMGSYGTGVGLDSAYTTALSDPINGFIQANIGSKVSICFTGGGTNVYTIAGETAISWQVPQLRIYYNPPCAGTPGAGYVTANVLEACSTSTVTLTETYAPAFNYGGISFQWQSSPDSASWTDISGATTKNYSFTGLAATTYYRRQATCAFSGLSSFTGAPKINYITTCCSGTPSAGLVTPSTTYCSSCPSLTLDLSGYSTGAGMSYQWQISTDNATWGTSWGADSTSHTLSPFGAYYYRCKSTCFYSSLSSYSAGTFVGYDYKIIKDSITVPGPGSCAPAYFYTRVNGSAMLSMKTWYGDGTTDSVALVNDTAYSYLNTPHNYTFPGLYHVKRVLYYANTVKEDSVTSNYVSAYCNVLPIGFYLDGNGNCVRDTTEHYNGTPIHVKVDSNGIPIDTFSATSGYNYIAYGAVGTVYSFSAISVLGALYVSCPASGVLYDTIHYTSGTYPKKDIGLSCSGVPSNFDLTMHSVNQFTRGQHQGTTIYVSNIQCTPVDATLKVNYSPKYVFIGLAHPPPSSTSGSSLTWNLYGLSSVNAVTEIDYRVENSTVTGHLWAGDTVHSTYTITPMSGDLNPSDNSYMIIDTVTSSYDPNEIIVTPSGCITSDTDGTVLRYTIHFTNVGNDTAFNIFVLDTLSDNVDPESLEILMASNTMNLTVRNDGTHNIAKFDFPGINLLDSGSCPTCMGAVMFSIKTRQGLPTGSTIFGRAGIYFDDNDVVMTNTVQNTKGGCFANAVNNINHQEGGIEILPNPATNELSIGLFNQSTNQQFNELTITNSIGRRMQQQTISQTQTKVDISKLPAGLYYITFRGDKGTEVRKFVKL